ncbi:MAG TPA: Uma2 family endonuclease [Humisphaera sp.]|nr:Uma2 family endonuclease [Humisphaera sp.]
MSLETKPITAEELFEMGDIGRCELVRGEIVHRAPAGAEHGDVAGEIFGRIWSFVREHKRGKVYAAETGFTLARNPDVTRGADVAFVRSERVPRRRIRGYFPGAPDLAVEVISPTDRHAAVLEKVDEWLAAGTVSVWVVDSGARSVEIYRSGNQVLRYRENDELRDDPALPGMVLKLDDLFEITEATE